MAIFFKAENINAQDMVMDKSTLDIFFKNDSLLNGYLKKMIRPFHIRPSSLVWLLDTFVLNGIRMKFSKF